MAVDQFLNTVKDLPGAGTLRGQPTPPGTPSAIRNRVFPADLGRALVRYLRQRVPVLAFHEKWIRATFDPATQISALTCPRGSAKTWICAQLAGAALRPGSPIFESRVETLIVSASFEQSRIMLSFIREALVDVEKEYRYLESGNRLNITHKATGTRLRVLSSSGKRAMGLSQFGTIYADEPASYESRGGQMMFDALRQSLGKRPDQRLVLIGTRSPADPLGWWPQLLDAGSSPGTHVTVMAAPDDEPWDAWSTVRKVNPLVMHSESLRKTILRERDDARRNPTLRPAYEAYRLNRAVFGSDEMLVQLAAWDSVERRAVPPREGSPVLGLDLGSERSWSAAWILWDNGRSEVYALCPGIPDLAEREKQDAMPAGLYQRLHDDGVLLVDDDRRVARPEVLIDHLVEQGIDPRRILLDRFMFNVLKDVVGGRWPITQRVTRWSEATEDISAFRSLVADGPLSIVPEGRALARMSLAQASVRSDEQGSVKLQKRRHSRSRDDLAVSGTLAAGEFVRRTAKPPEFSMAVA